MIEEACNENLISTNEREVNKIWRKLMNKYLLSNFYVY